LLICCYDVPLAGRLAPRTLTEPHEHASESLVRGESRGQIPGRLNSLCRFENGFPNRLGYRNGQEETFRIEIIFAGFVDDTDLPKLEGIGIRKGKIDLPFLQRNGITFVVHADEESSWSAFKFLHRRVFTRTV
jgi:hypothetical protein